MKQAISLTCCTLIYINTFASHPNLNQTINKNRHSLDKSTLALAAECANSKKWCGVHEVFLYRFNKLEQHHNAQNQTKESDDIMIIDSWCKVAKELNIDLTITHPDSHKSLFDVINEQNNNRNNLYARTFPLQWRNIKATLSPSHQ